MTTEGTTTTMNREDSLKALITAGRTQDVKEYIGRRVEVAQDRYAGIRGDEALSDKARQYQLAVQYLNVRDDANKRFASEAERVTRTDRDDAGRVFGVSGLSGDAASLAISMRDAADRVASAEDGDELAELLASATRRGDEVLARAVAERATEQQNAKVMETFLDDRPRLREAGERLWNAKRAQGADRWGITMKLYELMPAELSSMSDAQIEVIADDPPAAAPSSSQSSWTPPVFDSTSL